MKKCIVLGLILCLTMMAAIASPVDSTRAKKLASNFWNLHVTPSRNGQQDIEFQNLAVQMGMSQIYILQNINGEGFVIISADDRAIPVLGYAEHGRIDVNNVPDNFLGWLQGCNSEIQHAVDSQVTQSETAAAEWNALAAGIALAPKSPTAVSPLLSTTWDQGSPYNALCPGTAYNRSPVGCVATAMAQVMKYWAYPPKGQGSHSYTCSYYGSTLSANFGNTTYSWSSMPSSVYSSNTQVATISYHCGVSVEMNYTPDGSGAQTISYYDNDYSAEHALNRFFGYSNAIHGEHKSQFTDNEWIQMLKTELNASRPVIYSGFDSDNTSGHCFVCDGYNNNNQFHFNWGWGGSYDCYCSISSLIPGGTGWGGGNGNFSYNQQALFNVQPPALVLGSAFSITPTSGTTVEHGVSHSFTATVRNSQNTAFNGSLKLVIEADNGVLKQMIQEYPNVTIAGNSTNSKTFTSVITALPGNYKLTLYYKANNSTEWTNVGIGSGSNRLDITVILNPDSFENNNNTSTPYVFTPNFSNNQATINTTGANIHVGDNFDYYKFDLPAGYRYNVESTLYDSQNNPQQYSGNIQMRVSINNAAWAMLQDTTSGTFALENGGPVLYKVWPTVSGAVGTYLLSIKITRTPNTGIDDREADGNIAIYPNPTTGICHLECESGEGQCFVYDVFGKLLISKNIEGKITDLDLSDFAIGTYIVRIIHGNENVATQKIIKR